MTTANSTPTNQPNQPPRPPQPPRPGCVMVSLLVVTAVVLGAAFHPVLFAIVLLSPLVLVLVALATKSNTKGDTDE